jgi:hypothetical protein
VIVIVSGPSDEMGGIGSVDEPDCTVVVQQQVVGNFSDRRTTRITVPSNGQQQLVLSWREACGPRLDLAPAFEMSEPGPQRQETAIDLIGQTHSRHDIIVTRCNCPEFTVCAWLRAVFQRCDSPCETGERDRIHP